MFSENTIMAISVIISIVLFTSTTTNALAIANETNISDMNWKNKHASDVEILDSLVGQTNKQNYITRQSFFDNIHSNADFFECNEQAQTALSTHTENYRNWEAFFKRNSLNDTIAVRYCCNLLEYADNAQMSLSPECRERVRLQDFVMPTPEIRHTCRQYEFYSAQCFLVRWMYWWIPLVVLLLIVLGILCSCCALKSRRNKRYLKPSKEKSSLVSGV